ncbi:hypothetical protein ACFSTD_18170 [Novosphingobium colocasiae]
MINNIQYAIIASSLALLSAPGTSFAEDKVDPNGPYLAMDTVGPRELEDAIKPYHRCLWRWVKKTKASATESCAQK